MLPVNVQHCHARHVSSALEADDPALVQPSDERIRADTGTVTQTRITQELVEALRNS